MIRSDNPHNCKRGGVSIYFKEQLTVPAVSLLNLNDYLGLEINIQNKKGYLISLYRSPSQSKDKFDHFIVNFEQLVSDRMSQNSLFILVTGNLKRARKSYQQIIFVSATKMDENTPNILNCYFSNKILILAHQTKYLHVGN